MSTSPGVEAADWHQLEVVIEAERNQLYNLSDSGFNYTKTASSSRDICKDPQPKAPASRLLLRPPTGDHSLHTHPQAWGLHSRTLGRLLRERAWSWQLLRDQREELPVAPAAGQHCPGIAHGLARSTCGSEVQVTTGQPASSSGCSLI